MPGPGSRTKTCHDAPCTLGAAALAPAVQRPLYCSSSVSNAWMSAVFNKYASKPAARHASRMTSSPYAVRAIKYGRPDESASRSRRARSSPVMSCKERSRIAQSGWKILAIESAVRPSAAAARTPRQGRSAAGGDVATIGPSRAVDFMQAQMRWTSGLIRHGSSRWWKRRAPVKRTAAEKRNTGASSWPRRRPAH
jgi:hypothetical protein